MKRTWILGATVWLLADIMSLCGEAKRPEALPGAWMEATEPFHIAGPIYYVGTKGLCVYLLKTPGGDILLSGAMPESAAGLKKSIEKIGVKPGEIKILLISHAHADHVGTLAEMKKWTGAKVEVLKEEVDLLKSGGKLDYLFAKNDRFHFAPVAADAVLKDGDEVALGGVKLKARLTPGHTRGTTTWTTTVEEGGKRYEVVFADGAGINPGTRFVRSPSYPGIAKDYAHTFEVLESLHPDIFLAYHAEFFDMEGKRSRMEKEGVRAWLDPEGYRRIIEERRAAFEEQVAKEGGATPSK